MANDSPLCKEIGHNWQPTKNPFETEKRNYQDWIRCECGWCGKKKWFEVEDFKRNHRGKTKRKKK